MKIITEYVFPPIPIRTMDWSATLDNYDLGSPIGSGATKEKAILDLIEKLEPEEIMALIPAENIN